MANENVLVANFPDTLGSGKVLVRKDSDPAGQWLDLCCVESFNTTITTSTLKKKCPRSGIRRTTKSVTIDQEITGNFVCSTSALETLKLFFMSGDTVVANQIAGDFDEATYDLVYNRWIALGKENLDDTVVVTHDVTPVTITYEEDVDYKLDRKAGLIAPIEGGAIGNGDTVRITCDYGARTINKISAGQTTSQKRHIWYVGDPAEGVIQHKKMYANLFPSGDLAAIGEDWQQFTINFETEKHASYPNGYMEYEDHGIITN